MLFGPTNAPPFYTAMMKDMKDEWNKIFNIRFLYLKLHDGKFISQTAAEEVQIDEKVLAYRSKL